MLLLLYVDINSKLRIRKKNEPIFVHKKGMLLLLYVDINSKLRIRKENKPVFCTQKVL